MRIGLLEKGQLPAERATYFLKKSVAEDLVKRREAVWVVPGRTIQRISVFHASKLLGFATVRGLR
jgi:hypothetical protein